ncbi:hypothetical protein D9619_012991 [Psilocybe cf. subviscida]|uniref:NAD(P)-binding domain-containing protein n=1 Tax=Psilocybe cf. subviscida TaxID=2480587 RepID=A0A8H5BIE9_9AGAR|nr:hypothetical protein D9619_012991 [Psilocybe cf. subviscida]
MYKSMERTETGAIQTSSTPDIPSITPHKSTTLTMSTSSSSLNILVVGGSRHIGYHAALRLLDAGATVHYLLRNPAVFDADERVQAHVQAGRARLHKGDALNEDSTREVWSKASEERPVDLLLFTVGFTGAPKFSLTKGIIINPANLVTQCLLNLLCTMPKPTASTEIQTKLIILTSSGVTRASRALVPIPLKAMFGYLIAHPLADKFASERVLAYVAGWDAEGADKTKGKGKGKDAPKYKWDGALEPEPSTDLTGEGWKNRTGLPARGTLPHAMILRAGLLTDGECRADAATDGKPVYRVAEGELGGYTISRKDVAHFILEAVTKRWSEYGDRQVNVVY